MNLINEQLGRILLGLAVVAAVFLVTSNPAAKTYSVGGTERPVQVKLDQAALTALSTESYFAEAPVISKRTIIEKDPEVRKFEPVDLDLPPANVRRPAQLLPEPGPSLEGSDKLPRFGDEFLKNVKAAAAIDPKNPGMKNPDPKGPALPNKATDPKSPLKAPEKAP
ncbi:MAG TPA: hypothetical protein VGP72_11810 [Planctomycetota bacterium]|jgi:hypothetical protein